MAAQINETGGALMARRMNSGKRNSALAAMCGKGYREYVARKIETLDALTATAKSADASSADRKQANQALAKIAKREYKIRPDAMNLKPDSWRETKKGNVIMPTVRGKQKSKGSSQAPRQFPSKSNFAQ